MGKAAIQKAIEFEVARNTTMTIVDLQVSGDTVNVRAERRGVVVQSAGVERAIDKITFTFKGDKIARWTATLDTSDAQSVAFSNFGRVSGVFVRKYDAVNRGDVAAALAAFTDDAGYEGLGRCAAVVCSGRVAIQQELEREVADKVNFTAIQGAAKVSGDVLTHRVEIRSATVSAAKVERVVAVVTMEVKATTIHSLRYALDPSDPQTRAFVANQKLPQTGADISSNAALWLALGGAMLLAIGWVLRRRYPA